VPVRLQLEHARVGQGFPRFFRKSSTIVNRIARAVASLELSALVPRIFFASRFATGTGTSKVSPSAPRGLPCGMAMHACAPRHRQHRGSRTHVQWRMKCDGGITRTGCTAELLGAAPPTQVRTAPSSLSHPFSFREDAPPLSPQ
jgi:hypothetical protein